MGNLGDLTAVSSLASCHKGRFPFNGWNSGLMTADVKGIGIVKDNQTNVGAADGFARKCPS